jgi:hypothetical protein
VEAPLKWKIIHEPGDDCGDFYFTLSPRSSSSGQFSVFRSRQRDENAIQFNIRRPSSPSTTSRAFGDFLLRCRAVALQRWGAGGAARRSQRDESLG